MTVISPRQYRTVVTVQPTVEPVSLSDAKLHLRVDCSDEDDLITSLIVAARQFCEAETRRAFINTTFRLSLDEFPSEIRVPGGKLQSVTSITYVDDNGSAQTLATTEYTSDTDSEPGRIWLAYDESWPSIRLVPNSVKVTYVAGYGATAALVPDSIKAAIKIMIGHLYENREAVEVPMSVQALLNAHCIKEFF